MDNQNTPFQERTLPSLLKQSAQAENQSRIIFGTKSYSAFEIQNWVEKFAQGWAELGVSAGTRVGLICSNQVEFILAWLSLGSIGAITVPINTASQRPQLEYFLSHSQSEYLVFEIDFLPLIAPCLTEKKTGQLRELFLIGAPEDLPSLPIPSRHFWDVAIDSGNPIDHSVRPQDDAAILYTGGTTGASKGVRSSHSQYYWWGTLLGRGLGIRREDIWMTCLPLFHVNAQATLLAALGVGATVVIEPRFSASRFWPRVRECGATVLSLLGTMAHILQYKHAPEDSDRSHQVRMAFCPGLSAELRLDFEERFNLETVDAYGSTELNCVTFSNSDPPAPPGSMGQVVPEFEVQVVNDRDQPLPVDAVGELVVRPKIPWSIFNGYYRDEGATAKAWRNLWFHSGDRIRRDAFGNLYFVDRLNDCIRRRGENISSFEVESILFQHTSISECAAYPVPSELGEDDVMVSVVLRPDHSLDPQDLLAWCRDRLPRFSLPRYIVFEDHLPKTAVGRIKKFELRARGVTPSTWDGEDTES